MVTEIVTTLVSPILQQNLILQQSLIQTENRSRKRIDEVSIDDDMSEYSEI